MNGLRKYNKKKIMIYIDFYKRISRFAQLVASLVRRAHVFRLHSVKDAVKETSDAKGRIPVQLLWDNLGHRPEQVLQMFVLCHE